MEEKKEYNLQNDSKMINVNLKRIGRKHKTYKEKNEKEIYISLN